MNDLPEYEIHDETRHIKQFYIRKPVWSEKAVEFLPPCQAAWEHRGLRLGLEFLNWSARTQCFLMLRVTCDLKPIQEIYYTAGVDMAEFAEYRVQAKLAVIAAVRQRLALMEGGSIDRRSKQADFRPTDSLLELEIELGGYGLSEESAHDCTPRLANTVCRTLFGLDEQPSS